MVRRKVSNPLAFAVLGSLGERPMHPYEISTMLKARGKDGSIKLNYGSLYSVVTALEKAGFVEAVETVREGNRPERTIYAITAAGREEFDGWLAELLGTPEKDFSQLEAGLAYLPAFAPDRVADLLEQRAGVLEQEAAGLERMHDLMRSKKFPEIFWIESEFRVELLRTEITFARRLAERIRTDDLEGTEFWRRTHDLVAELGVHPADLLKDPVKYFGVDFPWLREVPPEAQ
ncbi:PadR family transcriptional regulator [Kribbella italica]|uniref:DNA-binding PadR family transcriptional regulator n=1 Tax=Kribbella italica TaxID=1540520 RepID=A0A7W9JC49_9ACTN|nr:PadR family transcriptional regulator [Kribbella italica]MBB5839408.1 DNA-binding PadR family transcriptional regulator [Kribbella italica]